MCPIRHKSIEKQQTEMRTTRKPYEMSYEKGTRTNIDKWLLNYVPKQRPNFIGKST